MTVRMRSQDIIFGFGNDIPCFSFVHEMMFVALKKIYPTLQYGVYHHSADSFHAYERDFDKLQHIAGITKKKSSYHQVLCPMIINAKEVNFLRTHDFSNIPESYKFTKWLTTFSSSEYQSLLTNMFNTNDK